jgi:hypothetical protein|tara:strand:- start:1831 stop:1971 length:141 start_codon:yes stop_codon:yes gene_type:complete
MNVIHEVKALITWFTSILLVNHVSSPSDDTGWMPLMQIIHSALVKK